MFEFAISHNQRRRPTQLLYAAVIISCILHILMLIVLIENPWLLKGGLYRHFRGLTVYTNEPPEPASEFDNYRTIAILRPMAAPSPETLKKLLYDWDSAGKEGAQTPSTARWGDDEKTAPDEDIKISDRIDTTPEPAPAGNAKASDMTGTAETNISVAEETEGGQSSETADIAMEPANKTATATPVVETPPEEDIALNIAPARIPDGISTHEESDSSDNFKVFDTEQQAIDSRGSGIFDAPQGWPLEEYASMIKKRVTEKWFIPSNLRNSNGYTTIVFFIDRNGQNFGTRIVDSSGNNSLDITALNAIINSNPFPPLPQGFPGDHVGVKYVFIPQPQ